MWIDAFLRRVRAGDTGRLLLHGGENPADATPVALEGLFGVEASFVIAFRGEAEEGAGSREWGFFLSLQVAAVDTTAGEVFDSAAIAERGARMHVGVHIRFGYEGEARDVDGLVEEGSTDYGLVVKGFCEAEDGGDGFRAAHGHFETLLAQGVG